MAKTQSIREQIRNTSEKAAQKVAQKETVAKEEQKKQEEEKTNKADNAKNKITTFSQTSLDAIVSFGKASVSAASEFEKSMSKIQYASGATNQQMLATRQLSQNLFAQNVGQGWEDIGNAVMKTNQLTGKQGTALEQTAKNALLLKDAFGLDVADSVKSADSLMKKFGITSDQAFGLIAQGQSKTSKVNGDMLKKADQAMTGLEQMKFSQPGAAMETIKKQITVDVLIPVGEKLIPVLQSFGKWLSSHEPQIRAFGAALANSVGQGISLVTSGLSKAEPFIDSLAEGAVKIWKSISHWSGFVPVISGIAAALGIFVVTVKVVTTATKIWAAASALLNGTLLMNPVFLIIAAIVGLGVALVVAYKKCEAFRNLVNGVWAAIKTGFSGVVSFFTTAIPNLFNRTVQAAVNLWRSISSWAAGVPQLLGQYVNSLWTSLSNGTVAIFQRLFASVSSFFTMIMTGIIGFVSNIVAFITSGWTALWSATVAVFTWILNFEITVWSTIWNTLVGIVGAIVGFIAGSWNAISSTTMAVFNGVVSAISTAWSSLLTGLTSIFGGIGSFFSGVWDEIKAVFVGGINWVIDQINSMIGMLNGVLSTEIFGHKIGITIPTINHVVTGSAKNAAGSKAGGGSGTGGHGGTAAVAGSFASGLANVPYDGFIAELHKGERVLTADENKGYSSGAPLASPVRAGASVGSGGQMNINLTVDVKGGSMDTQQTADLMQQFRLAMQQVFMETMRRGGIEGAS